VVVATLSLVLLRPPDILVSGDGHHVGITGGANELLVLRDERGNYARENLTELAGMRGPVRQIADWPGARCSPDFCALELHRTGRDWRLLIGRGRDPVPERALYAACERADIVISDRWLPRSCHPALLKADRHLLSRTGGLAIDLANRKVSTVAETQGEHGWWTPEADRGASPLRRGSGQASAGSGRAGQGAKYAIPRSEASNPSQASPNPSSNSANPSSNSARPAPVKGRRPEM
jgi:competence protein ComEC